MQIVAITGIWEQLINFFLQRNLTCLLCVASLAIVTGTVPRYLSIQVSIEVKLQQL